MYNVATLRFLAGSHSRDAFETRVGPFVLVRRPPAAILAKRMMAVAGTTLPVTKRTDDPAALILEFMIDFEDLVALPALPGRNNWRIGRGPENEFCVDEPSVSKTHASIGMSPERVFWVVDHKSTNGTLLQDEEVKRAPMTLRDGDVVTFGDADFWFLRAETLYERVAT